MRRLALILVCIQISFIGFSAFCVAKTQETTTIDQTSHTNPHHAMHEMPRNREPGREMMAVIDPGKNVVSTHGNTLDCCDEHTQNTKPSAQIENHLATVNATKHTSSRDFIEIQILNAPFQEDFIPPPKRFDQKSTAKRE